MSIESVMPSSHPLSSPSPSAFNLSQHQGLFQWVSSSHQAAKELQFQLQHQSFWIHGILQFRILEWVVVPFSRGSSQHRIEPRSLPLQVDSLPAEPQGKPKNTGGVAFPFSSRSSHPRNWTGISYIAGGFFTNWALREAWYPWYDCIFSSNCSWKFTVYQSIFLIYGYLNKLMIIQSNT